MRSRAIVTTLAALVLVAAGCSASGGTGGTLEGTTWLLKSYDNGSAMVDVPQGVYPDAVFASGKVSGVLVCNSYTGGYTQSGSSLTISALAMTQMACADTSPDVETPDGGSDAEGRHVHGIQRVAEALRRGREERRGVPGRARRSARRDVVGRHRHQQREPGGRQSRPPGPP